MQNIAVKLIQLLDLQMAEPQLYGWFHILWLAITVVGTVALCLTCKQGTEKQVQRVLLISTVVVAVFEVYKQINFTFSVSNGAINADYQWYAFPFQFCDMPLYVRALALVFSKGRVHKSLCAFLSCYAVFAGVCVMLAPTTVFISTIGINLQTMICHSIMITVGVYFLYTGYVLPNPKTLLRAVPVFAAGISVAVILNELANLTGLLERESFNMFYISPHCEPSLPVYSLVQESVPYPWCLIIYLLGFTAAAGIILLIARGAIFVSDKLKKKI